MLISVVERQAWKRCRRKWDLTSFTRQNYEPVSLASALKLGDMIQRALSAWTEDYDKDPIGEFVKISAVELEKTKTRYKERVGAPISNMELDPLYQLIELGVAMCTNYKAFHKTPLPKRFTPIQTEQRALVAIPNTEHWTCPQCYYDLPMSQGGMVNRVGLDGQRINPVANTVLELCPNCNIPLIWGNDWLRGTIDTLVQDDKGMLFPLERKTYGQRPEPAKLAHDDQQLAYIWMMNKLFPGRAGGVLYDGLWKRAVPPKTSKSKITGKDNTIADLFFRDTFVRPPAEIEEFEILLAKECIDMRFSIENGLFYINRVWQGCWDCGVSRICDAMSRDEDVDYVIQEYYQKRPDDSPIEDDD